MYLKKLDEKGNQTRYAVTDGEICTGIVRVFTGDYPGVILFDRFDSQLIARFGSLDEVRRMYGMSDEKETQEVVDKIKDAVEAADKWEEENK